MYLYTAISYLDTCKLLFNTLELMGLYIMSFIKYALLKYIFNFPYLKDNL